MGVDAKICGLTRPEDAAIAVAHGAWRLGVVFAGGPRRVAVAQAAEVVAAAGGVPVIGVFGEQPIEEILEVTARCALGGVQFHGASSAAAAERVRAAGLTAWRVTRVPPVSSARLAADAEGADLLLLEPTAEGPVALAGGRGQPIALEAARDARRAAPPGIRVGLAGGLTPERLAEAIRVVGPDVVDVSSGVEVRPGIKDPDRLVRFLEIARDVHHAG